MAYTREEVIAAFKRNPKTEGMTDAQIAAKADEYLAKIAGSAEPKAAPKTAPKATPAAKAPPKPPAAKTPEPPKAEVAVVAMKAPARVMGPEAPDRTRDYSDTAPPMTRTRAAEVMPKPEMELIGIKQGGEGVYKARESVPSVMKYETDLIGDEVRNMRGTLKAVRPELAVAVDEAPDEEVRSLYYRMVK